MAERITPAQIRGARGLLDWSMVDLAKAAGVSISTVRRMEWAEPVSAQTSVIVQAALEAAGMRFLADDGDGAGLRLRPR